MEERIYCGSGTVISAMPPGITLCIATPLMTLQAACTFDIAFAIHSVISRCIPTPWMTSQAACTFGTIAGPVLGGLLAMHGDHYAAARVAMYLTFFTSLLALLSTCSVESVGLAGYGQS